MNSATNPAQWGLTKPISLAKSRPQDISASTDFISRIRMTNKYTKRETENIIRYHKDLIGYLKLIISRHYNDENVLSFGIASTFDSEQNSEDNEYHLFSSGIENDKKLIKTQSFEIELIGSCALCENLSEDYTVDFLVIGPSSYTREAFLESMGLSIAEMIGVEIHSDAEMVPPSSISSVIIEDVSHSHSFGGPSLEVQLMYKYPETEFEEILGKSNEKGVSTDYSLSRENFSESHQKGDNTNNNIYKSKSIRCNLMYISRITEFQRKKVEKGTKRIIEEEASVTDLSINDIRCLSSLSAKDAILESVPDKNNFFDTLLVIRHWAISRGIYGESFGYLNGISLAILVARICQLFPHMCCSLLVPRFFRVFSRWNFKKISDEVAGAGPVLISTKPSNIIYSQNNSSLSNNSILLRNESECFIEDIKPNNLTKETNVVETCTNEIHVNNNILSSPSSTDDTTEQHIMKIIVPVHPPINCSSHIHFANYRTIIGELQRGAHLSQINQLEDINLAEDIFEGFDSFIQIEVCGANEKVLGAVCIIVEERISGLMMILPWDEKYDTNSIPSATESKNIPFYRLWPFSLSLSDPQREYSRCCCYLIGVSFPQEIDLDLRPSISFFSMDVLEHMDSLVDSFGYRCGGMFDVRIKRITTKQLPDPLERFRV